MNIKASNKNCHNLQFNALPLQELMHHSNHQTMSSKHEPGCTLKCTCGLINGDIAKANMNFLNS